MTVFGDVRRTRFGDAARLGMGNIVPVQANPAAHGRAQARQRLNQLGLPVTLNAGDAEDFAFAQAEGDTPHNRLVTVIQYMQILHHQDFLAWMGDWYHPGNLVVSVAGNTSHEETTELIGRYLGDGRSGDERSIVGVNGSLPARRVVAEARPISQANLALGLPALARKDPDRYALQILNSLLGRGMSSRLFKEVRERRGLAYAVGSSVSRHADTGMFAVSAGVSPENLAEAVRVILDELLKVMEEPVGEEELTKARDYTVGSFRLSLETPMALGQRAGESLLTMGEIEPIETVVERLQSISAEDILRVARRVLPREKAALAVVGPDVQEEALAELLL